MSNNPFSVPDSPPALVEPQKRSSRKSLHRLVFSLILVVWYGLSLLLLEEGPGVLLTFHAILFAKLYDGNAAMFDAKAYTPLLWVTEVAFAGLVCATVLRRSFAFTLAVLAFAVCWSVANFYYAFGLFAEHFK